LATTVLHANPEVPTPGNAKTLAQNFNNEFANWTFCLHPTLGRRRTADPLDAGAVVCDKGLATCCGSGLRALPAENRVGRSAQHENTVRRQTVRPHQLETKLWNLRAVTFLRPPPPAAWLCWAPLAWETLRTHLRGRSACWPYWEMRITLWRHSTPSWWGGCEEAAGRRL